MNMQKIQICLLAIIAMALVYIATIYTISSRYTSAGHPLTTLDRWTGNIYTYGATYYLHKNGYSTDKVDLRDYLMQDTKPKN